MLLPCWWLLLKFGYTLMQRFKPFLDSSHDVAIFRLFGTQCVDAVFVRLDNVIQVLQFVSDEPLEFFQFLLIQVKPQLNDKRGRSCPRRS
jgi:hypothetical protein